MAAPQVLLTDTTTWSLSAQLAISLSHAGMDVFAVCQASGHPLLKTSVVRQVFPYHGLRPLDSLAAAIEATNPQIVIPCDDRAVEHLHELHARARRPGTSVSSVAALIERSLGPPESYPTVSARYDLLRIAHEEGLRVPATSVIRTAEDLKPWHSQQALPWVVKADGTWGGRGVKIAYTPEQAGQFFRELPRLFGAARALKRLIVNRDPFWLRSWWRRPRLAVSVQSYVQGRPANCAVFCWKGRVLAGFGVEVVSTDGQTGPATVVRVIDNPEMMLCAKRIASRLGLSGFFGLDFIIEDTSGAAYLIEMNPRCTPLCHLQLGKGRDMVEALWAQLSGQALRETPAVTQKAMIAYFPDAWNSQSKFLESSFHDIPLGEPALVQELLRPWQERSFLTRVRKSATLRSSV
jgi:hypothetical protein